MERTGLFTPEQEDFLATTLDEFFKFKNPLIETFDKTFFKILVQTLDNKGIDKLNAEWKLDLIPVVDAALANDLSQVRLAATDLLHKRINIPGLDEDTELLVFDTFTRFIVAAVTWFVEKKKANVTN